MKYNELSKTTTRQSRRRGGRGIASGRGKTVGRGTKGQGSRKSGGVRPGFEGGQMPLYMRLPKLRGFKSKRTPPQTVNIGQLELVKKPTVDNQALFEIGLLTNPYGSVKLLAGGELKTKKTVRLQSASKTAVTILEKAGGSFEAIPRAARPPASAAKE